MRWYNILETDDVEAARKLCRIENIPDFFIFQSIAQNMNISTILPLYYQDSDLLYEIVKYHIDYNRYYPKIYFTLMASGIDVIKISTIVPNPIELIRQGRTYLVKKFHSKHLSSFISYNKHIDILKQFISNIDNPSDQYTEKSNYKFLSGFIENFVDSYDPLINDILTEQQKGRLIDLNSNLNTILDSSPLVKFTGKQI